MWSPDTIQDKSRIRRVQTSLLGMVARCIKITIYVYRPVLHAFRIPILRNRREAVREKCLNNIFSSSIYARVLLSRIIGF